MNRTDPPPNTAASRRRFAVIGALGTIIEWYDFSLYLYLAPVLARVFFGSSGAEAGGLIATFGVFAAAYVARPVGAVAFGSIGDRYGRRLSLVVSAAMMAIALGLTALLPGAAAIGVAAAVLLLLLRIATSFAVGGEYSGILVFLLETGSRRHRGLVASLAPATSGLGALLAVGFSTGITGRGPLALAGGGMPVHRLSITHRVPVIVVKQWLEYPTHHRPSCRVSSGSRSHAR